VDFYTDVAKESETPRKASVVCERQQVKAGWNSEQDEKLKRGILRDCERSKDSMARNTAQATNAMAGAANPIGRYYHAGNTLKSERTSREAH
jgi:hypothetical protein